MRQVGEHDVRRHTEIDEARDLVDSDRLEPVHESEATGGRSKQSARLVVARERVLEERFHVRFGELLEQPVDALAARVPEGGEAGGMLLQETRRAAQIILERAVDLGADEFFVVRDERVEHEGHSPSTRMARLGPRLAVDVEFPGKIFDALPQQVGEHVGAHLPGLAEGLGIAGGRHPAGELRLDRPGQRLHLDLALGPAKFATFAAPERAHRLDLTAEDLLPLLVSVGRDGEVVRLPPGGKGDADPSVREVVDERPFLRDADWAVQRRDATSCADLDSFGNGRDCRARHRRIWIESAERMEVPFRRPNRLETVPVGEPGAFEQKTVLVAPFLGFVAREVEEAESNGGVCVREGRSAGALPRFVVALVQHDLETARQGPEDLQHRDVERNARRRQPRAPFFTAESCVRRR